MNELKAGAYRTLSVIFASVRVAEIDERIVAGWLRAEALEADRDAE